MANDQIGSASIGLAVDSSGVDAGLNRMEASVTQTARSLSTLGRRGADAVDQIGAGATNAASQTERATRRIQNEIQRTTAVAQAGERGTRAYYEAIANQRGANLNVLRPYLDQLEQVRAAQNAAAQSALRNGAAYQNNAQSAAQLSNNLRGVPAQLTDIVTSLQGGQQPLTVFLQQGGQLRDMFGSIGGAARALGGYLVSLISPLTVGAAAIAALALAYNQGSKEADAFRKSIILTGNAAGVTTSQLAALAKQGSETAGTVGAQAEALAALVGTGKVGADQLAKASTAAVQAQKYLGLAVEDTVKSFADLGKDPLQATLKLNEQYNYLTLATYQQIKALEQQGRVSEAAKVAQSAYADTLSERSKKLESSLGSLEKSWNFVRDAAKGAWDRMLDVVREDTIDEKIKKAQENLKKANAAYLSFIGTKADKDADKAEAQRQLDRLLKIKKVGELKAQYDAEDAKRRDAAISFDQQEEQFLSRRAKMEREIAQARTLGTQSAARGEDPAVTEERIQKRIAQIRTQYADLNNQGIESQIAAVERLGKAQELAAQRARILLQGDQDAGFNKTADKQDAYLQKVAKLDEDDLARQKRILQQKLALTAQEAVSEDGRAAQQEKLADLRAQIAAKDVEIGNRRLKLSIDLRNADIANTRAAFDSPDKLLEARTSDTEALKQQLQAQNDQNAALGLTGRALDEFNTKLTEERATRLELNADILDTIAGREAEADELRKQAQLLRDLNKAQIDGANKAKAIEANKAFWESVDKTAKDAFTAIFEGGKNMAQRLRDALKAGILDILYQITVKKWIINISTSLSGQSLAGNIGSLLGIPGASAATTAGGASSLSTTASLANIGKSVYDSITTGFTGLATSIGTGIASIGSLFGSQAVSAFGTGLTLTGAQAGTAAAAYSAAGNATVASGLTSGAAAAPLITAAAGIASGVLAGNLLSGGYSAIGGSSLNATAIGTAVGTYLLPGIGSLLGGAVGGVVNSLFGRKAPKVESQGIQGTISASSGVTSETFANILEKGGLFRSDKRYTNTAAVTGATDEGFDKTVTAMIAAVKGFGKAIGETATNIDSYTKDFKLTLTGEAAKDQELISKLFSDTGDELATLLVPNLAKLTKEGETASAALQRVATDYVAMNAALGAIGLSFVAVGASSLESREALLALVGGLDNFVSQAEFFSQNFLSEAERTAAVRKQLEAAFADLGISAIPKTRDEFKALVQGLDLTSESGQKMYAGLLSLQQAFASVTPQIDAAAEAAKAAAEAIAQQKEQRSLDIQLMEALGDQEGALAAKRSDALAALLTDQARLTQQQIYAAQDAKAAADAAKEAQKAYDDLIKSSQEAARAATQSLANAIAGSITQAEDAAAAFLKLNDALLIGESSTLNAAQKYEVSKEAFTKAGPDDLESAQKAFLDASKSLYGQGSLQYAQDFANVVERNRLEAANQASTAENIKKLLRSFISDNIGRFASGGIANGLAIVGEQGPELVDFRNTARVYTAPDTASLLGGGSNGMSVEFVNFLQGLITQVIIGNGYAKTTADALQFATRGQPFIYTKEVTA